jgi:hypothetical protein
MTQEQIEFLYSHKQMHHNFTTSGVIPHLPREDSEKFLEIAKTFQPEYSTSLWCGDCVMEMIDFVYKQASLKKEEVKPEVKNEKKRK